MSKLPLPVSVLFLCAAAFAAAPAPQGAAAPQDGAKPQVYDPQADAAADIAAALRSAKKENRRVLIQWGANWCGWCIKLDAILQENRELRRKLSYEYDFVHVDIGRFDKNLELAKRYGATVRESGVPFLTVLAADGKVLANQETGSLERKVEGKGGHDPAKLLSFLSAHQAPYRKAQAVVDEALAAAKEAEKRVFLSFGAPWCGWCHKLEGVLAQDEVAKVLAREFVLAKVDVDRTVAGKELLSRYRGSDRGGIPWFVFLESDGTPLVTSDGPDGNLGCPYTEDEVKMFGEILGRASRTLSKEHILAVQAAFTAEREKEKPQG